MYYRRPKEHEKKNKRYVKKVRAVLPVMESVDGDCPVERRGGQSGILAMEQFRQVGVRGAWVGVWIAF